YPSSHIVGCSTAGEISGTEIFDDSLSVGVVRFDHTAIDTKIAAVQSANESYAAGELLAQQLYTPALRGVLVLSDGIGVNGSELVRGLNAVLPSSVVTTGGLAGDGERMERTWVIKDGAPQSGFVSGVGLYGERVRISHGSRGGWDIFGPERLVTRSEGNVLYELDGRPALQLYKRYLGERASGLPATAMLFPLALRADSSDQKSIVRTILAVDEQTQSMTFAGDIPQGYLAQLMRANFSRLVDGAADAALMAQERQPQAPPVLSIAISCVGRRLVLGGHTEEELEATLDGLPEGTQQIGFYSYGEISPYEIGHCDLHNQTMTLTTISEE
ncbi:MAG: FIST N-terminal domain-containing protein, partial [Anaerolineae bacterium]